MRLFGPRRPVRWPCQRLGPLRWTVAILDGAESLLAEAGHPEITTRKLAERAGVNHGLVHCYFDDGGSLPPGARAVLRSCDRKRALCARDAPFIEKRRTARPI